VLLRRQWSAWRRWSGGWQDHLIGPARELQLRSHAGAGGSSGEDSMIRIAGTDVPLVRGIGGAGGGGAPAVLRAITSVPSAVVRILSMHGPGGGGAGSDDGTPAQNGQIPIGASYTPEVGRAGGSQDGGSGGLGAIASLVGSAVSSPFWTNRPPQVSGAESTSVPRKLNPWIQMPQPDPRVRRGEPPSHRGFLGVPLRNP